MMKDARMLLSFIVFLLRSFRPLGAEEKYDEQNHERRIHCDLMRRLHLGKAELPDESTHACEKFSTCAAESVPRAVASVVPSIGQLRERRSLPLAVLIRPAA